MENKDFHINNQERIRKVENREGKPKYYHASKIRYKIGDTIKGFATNSDTKSPSVFLSTSEQPHYSLKNREDIKEYLIYRVIPKGNLKPGYDWEELTSSEVEVVEILGSAKGFVEKNDFGFVKLRRKNALIERRMKEYYHNKNIQNPNIEGEKLLEKIKKKYD